MPAISTGSKVLLTGGSGFLGAYILKVLLDEGFTVRAAVRSPSKAEFLKARFPEHADKLSFVFVEDITAPGAFDDAVKGVDGIIHAASPLPIYEPNADPQALIGPAVEGTLGILRSANEAGNVKRVVVTSSIESAWEVNPKKLPATYDETHWNEEADKIVEEKGRDASPITKYAASKVLAEKAAWKWIQEAKPTFDLVTILPGYLWGPIISETTADIKGSNAVVVNPLKKAAIDSLTEVQLLQNWQPVDVRDCATSHVRALLVPEAGGERFISCATTITWKHIYEILSNTPVEGVTVPLVPAGILDQWKPSVSLSHEKSEKVLGAHYRPIDETVRDTVIGAIAVGWKQ